MTTAFDPVDLAGTRLANRIAMAPMTRSRADAVLRTPTPLVTEYYAQRASAGLIITEGVHPVPEGQGYPFTPGLHSRAQIAAWREVTDAVHERGGRIFAQLMHSGRIGHPDLLDDGLHPVGPSPVAAAGQVFTPEGPRDLPVPRELTGDQVREAVEGFADAARNAVEAGFDGVEVHGANGYLVHQFLATGSNHRTDEWGGPVAHRIRFAVEVVKAVAAAIGPGRTGLRISPANPLNDIAEADTDELYPALVDAIEPVGIAYLHVVEVAPERRPLVLDLRKRFTGTFILSPATEGPTGADSLALVEDGTADLVAFGRLFVANPDLPARLRTDGPYNEIDAATMYSGDARGYVDYPAL
ncbi:MULTISPECIES: alkene reductase [unclassified Streptomyces]|uniref:alkene reductase n=1 Tax=unclassified Streptomyces TaxID=2593676 RepID=UPI001660106D|nr:MULTISPECIES: alkene reductase [unclassified Streptomyces]MBD0709259.1 alkene reductase [Streptomyces sp. CBMA291]MBD0713590.1 alkene reductase [Streptomyces sp. CBMA370]